MRLRKYLLLPLLVLILAGAVPAQVKKPGLSPTATPVPMGAREHADEIARAERQLGAIQSNSKRTLKAVRPLEDPRVVKRADGATLETDGREWREQRQQAVDNTDGVPSTAVSREEVVRARETAKARAKALEEWAFPPNGKYFVADKEAPTVVRDWGARGVIQTGPSGWQLAWQKFVRSLYDALDSIANWFDGLLSRRGNTQPVKVDTEKLAYFFYALLAGVVVGAAYLTWRALGGRVGRGKKTRDVLLEGEDAALLRLPPDELLDRAARYARDGDFREALRHRFLSLLLLLDARGVWRYDRRRTNWEHIARLKSAGAARAGIDALSALTLSFDRVRYGNEPCDHTMWQRFDSDAGATLDLLSRGGSTPPASTSGAPAAASRAEVRR
jgi:hypothetical protein